MLALGSVLSRSMYIATHCIALHAVGLHQAGRLLGVGPPRSPTVPSSHYLCWLPVHGHCPTSDGSSTDLKSLLHSIRGRACRHPRVQSSPRAALHVAHPLIPIRGHPPPHDHQLTTGPLQVKIAWWWWCKVNQLASLLLAGRCPHWWMDKIGFTAFYTASHALPNECKFRLSGLV
jgi:hypothetical protein